MDSPNKKTIQKVALSAFVLLSFALYTLVLRHDDSSSQVVAPTNTSSTTSTSTVTNATAKYKDGTYTGSVADAFYGNVQVQAIVKGGKVASVQFLQYPNDRPNSVEINQQAMPFLQQEAIKAQSAHVDVVSGATDTSQAFIQSLSVALSKAA